MNTATMTTYEKQLLTEKRKAIANTRCKLCQERIEKKPHVMFEERYFHLACLRREHN